MSKFNLPSPYVIYDPMADSNNSVSPLYNKVKIPALVVSDVQTLQYIPGSMFVGYVNIMIRSTGQFVCVQLPSLTVVNYSVWLGNDLDIEIRKSFSHLYDSLNNPEILITDKIRDECCKKLNAMFSNTTAQLGAISSGQLETQPMIMGTYNG